MIKLSIEPYCENCADFEPEASKAVGLCSHAGKRERSMIVRCKHHNRCADMVDYLEDQWKED